MARTLTQVDIHALMNELVKEATGQESTVNVVDASSFASAAEMVLATGTENVLNSLSLVLGRTFMAVRPYDAKFRLINALDTGVFSHRMRKISFYAKDALPSGDWNTNLNTNLAPGFTNGQNPDGSGDPQSTKSMWEQNPPIPLECIFSGSDVWQDSLTRYEYQIQQAFKSEDEFGQFVAGVMTEKANDIESQKEAFNRLAVLQHMGMIYDMQASGTQAVNLTYEFNQEFGTNYTTAQLTTTYVEDFLKFMTARIKLDSKKMTNRSKKWHWSPAKTVSGVSYSLLRHTPKDKQKLFLYSPLIAKMESYVFPSIFNPEYLKIENYEGVDFWQNEAHPSAINVTPAIPNVASPTSGQLKGDAVNLDMVVGLLFDEDGLMIDYQLEAARTTPVEARKGFMNTWWTFAKNVISDATENAVLYYMADPAPAGN